MVKRISFIICLYMKQESKASQLGSVAPSVFLTKVMETELWSQVFEVELSVLFQVKYNSAIDSENMLLYNKRLIDL
jgi:hypothetical protein